MMATLGFRPTTTNHLLNPPLLDHTPNHYHIAQLLRPCSLPFSNVSRFNKGRICMAMAVNNNLLTVTSTPPNTDNNNNNIDNALLLYDQWMTNSVAEIVKNLISDEAAAPLLVQLYSNDGDHTPTPTLKMDKAVDHDFWPVLTKKWEREETRIPDGVILVEQLDDNDDDNGEKKKKKKKKEKKEDGFSRAWGIVVQGKGVDCVPACYLLKTSSVVSLDVCCTHFCLMRRGKGCRESAWSQLDKNLWLIAKAMRVI